MILSVAVCPSAGGRWPCWSLATCRASPRPAALTGKVTRAGAGEPMAGAAVVVEELRREARTGRGRHLPVRRPGARASITSSVRAEGYSSRRTEVTVGAGTATLDLEVDLDLHFAEVLSVSPNPRPQFESYQPTSVLSAEDLARQLAGHHRRDAAVRARRGDAIARPGAGASGDPRPRRRPRAGPAGRPAHGRPVEPVGRPRRAGESGRRRSASRWCAARRRCSTAPTPSAASSTSSPTRFPARRSPRPPASFTLQSRQQQPAGRRRRRRARRQRHAWPCTSAAAASGPTTTRRPRARSRTRSRAAASSTSAAAGPASAQYAGVSYGYDDTKYGVPVIEEGADQPDAAPPRVLGPRRRPGPRPACCPSYRATLGVRRYTHTTSSRATRSARGSTTTPSKAR